MRSLQSLNGLTNGRECFGNKMQAKDRNKKFVFLLIFLLLFAPLYQFIPQQKQGIRIDGNFEDWEGIEKIQDGRNPMLPDDVDIEEYAFHEQGNTLFLYLKVYGKIFPGEKQGKCDTGISEKIVSGLYADENLAYIFIDSDKNASTGFAISETFGCDYALRISGSSGRIGNAVVLKHLGLQEQFLWEITVKAEAAFSGSALEASLAKDAIGLENYSLLFCVVRWDGNYDITDKNANLGIKNSGVECKSTDTLEYFLENAYFIDISDKLGLCLGENENRTYLYPVYSNNSTYLYSLTDQNNKLLTYPHFYDGFEVQNITSAVRNATAPLTPGEVYGVGWNGTHWLIGGTCRDGEGFPYLVDYDGTNFTNINLSTSPFGRFEWGAICSIAWNGTHWLIGDTEHTLALFDGTNFTNLTPKLEQLGWDLPSAWAREQHMSIAWNGTHWLIMVGNASNNASAYKPANIVLWDGNEGWEDLTLSLNLSVWDIGTYRVAWNGNFWLFGSAESSWDNYGIPTPPGGTLIKFDGQNFYRLGSLIPNSTDISDVVWSGSYFLIIGWNHTRNVSGLENYTETQVYLWDGNGEPVEITGKIEEDVGYVKAQHAIAGGFAAKVRNSWLIGGIKSQFPHRYKLPALIETNVSEMLYLNTSVAEDVDGGEICNATWNISGEIYYGNLSLNFSQPGIYNCSLTTVDNDAQAFTFNFSILVHGGWLNGSVMPENAKVYVDGSEIATSAGAFNLSLKPGTHTLNVSCENYNSYNQTFLISDFNETHMEITLTPVDEGAKAILWLAFSLGLLARRKTLIRSAG